VRPHAKGGLGEVFVALDEDLHREVALKEIQAGCADDPVSRQRFVREAEITGRLEHPGVVPVYGLGTYADGRPFYAMRFIKGDSLKDAIQKYHQADHLGRDAAERALALRQLLGRFVDVCNAVAYAHSRGVLHRDLKPGNIMLGPYGETLVVDWGLAKPLGRAESESTGEGTLRPQAGSGSTLTQAGSALGTPEYMSPEQAAGEMAKLGPASDVYALGATLYALLTGQAPCKDKDTAIVLERVRKGDIPPPRQINSRVPPALEAICLKAMALRPEDRYATPRALADDIERWLADEPVAVHREPLWQRAGRWGRRHKPLVAGTAVLLMTAVVALAVGLVAVNSERQRTEQARAAEAKRRQQAREALDELSSQIIDDWLAQQKELTPQHKQFLEKTLARYEEFAADTGQEEASRAGVAGAYLRVGNIRHKLGQMSEAETANRQAVNEFQRLTADYPAVIAFRQQLASSHNSLGVLLWRTGRAKEAEAEHRAALTERQRLADADPGLPAYREDVGVSHANLGTLLLDTGRAQETEAEFRAALDLFRPLAAEYPAMPRYRTKVAYCHGSLGNLFRDTGRPKDAEEEYRAMLSEQQRLVAEHPAVLDYRQELATGYANLAVLFLSTGRVKDAVAEHRTALMEWRRLATEHPAVPRYRQGLATCHQNLASALFSLGRAGDVEAELRVALKERQRLVTEHPAVPAYQHELATTLTSLGWLRQKRHELREALELLQQALPHHRAALKAYPGHPEYRTRYRDNREDLGTTQVLLALHAEAAATAEELVQAAVQPSDDYYNASCILSRCVPLAAKDAKLPEAKRKELSRRYADRALELLKQAVAKGWKDAAHMKKDTDFDPLRQRDDFKQLIAELEKAQPPAKSQPPAKQK
jgi:serine/threonine-protein kinase